MECSRRATGASPSVRAQRKEEREYARKEEYARRCRAQVRVCQG